jgi:Putative MetA-pathway of phenol degradation
MNRYILALLLASVSGPAFAQTAESPAAPAASAPAPAEPAICTDRPTKSNATCTVPPGKLQLETDLVNWARTDAGGVRTDFILYSNPTLKYGLTSRADIQVNIAPYEELRTHVAGATTTLGGVGDLYVRLKDRVTADSSKVQVAFIPFVKIPTARRGLGNRELESGLAVPIAVTLPDSFTLTFGPEADLLSDANHPGSRHFNIVNLVNLSKSVGKVTLIGELWSDWNFDPAGTVRQYSADAAIAWLVAPRLQLDAGANFGLNRNTPDAQVYIGLSTRF